MRWVQVVDQIMAHPTADAYFNVPVDIKLYNIPVRDKKIKIMSGLKTRRAQKKSTQNMQVPFYSFV